MGATGAFCARRAGRISLCPAPPVARYFEHNEYNEPTNRRTPMTLSDSVRRTIRRYGLFSRDARVLVALSGGGDSVALLVVLREIALADGFRVAGAAHLNHQLRGADADADEDFCRRLCGELGVPLYVERVDVATHARGGRMSLEQAAHDERHRFFERAARATGAGSVAVAHTKNDQAETFLLRLLRGSGPRGLSAMHPRSGLVVRPLIATTRLEVNAFLTERGMAFCTDATNADPEIPRNRVRHELIPFLEARFSPRIVDTLDREAAIAREDAAFLDAEATAAAGALIRRTAAGVELPIKAALAHPPAIARRVFRLAQQLASGGRFVGFDAVEAILQYAVSNSTGSLDLPGHRVNRRRDTLVLTRTAGRPAPDVPAAFAYSLGVPGRVEVPEARCTISADISSVADGIAPTLLAPLRARGDQVVLEGGRVRGPLWVRNRRPGDRLRPLGFHGRKKLQDVFVDQKTARQDRDAVPVIVDSAGQIVWVAGHAVAEDFRVTDRTKAVVILKRLPI